MGQFQEIKYGSDLHVVGLRSGRASLWEAWPAVSLLATALVLSSVIISCSVPAASDPGKLIASASIGPHGGTLTFSGGSVTISAGTISTPTTVRVTAFDAEPPLHNPYIQRLQSAVSIDLPDTQPLKPLDVELTVDPATLPNRSSPTGVLVGASLTGSGISRLIPALYDETKHSITFQITSATTPGLQILFYPVLLHGEELIHNFLDSATQNLLQQRAAKPECSSQPVHLPPGRSVSLGQQPSLTASDPMIYNCLSQIPGDDSAVEVTIINNRPIPYTLNLPNGAVPVPHPEISNNFTTGLLFSSDNADRPANTGFLSSTSSIHLRVPVENLPNKLLLHPDLQQFFAHSADLLLLDALPITIGGSATSSISGQLSNLSRNADHLTCLSSTPNFVINNPPVDFAQSARTGMHTAIGCMNDLVQLMIPTEQRAVINSVLTALAAQSSVYSGFEELRNVTTDTSIQTVEVLASTSRGANTPAVAPVSAATQTPTTKTTPTPIVTPPPVTTPRITPTPTPKATLTPTSTPEATPTLTSTPETTPTPAPRATPTTTATPAPGLSSGGGFQSSSATGGSLIPPAWCSPVPGLTARSANPTGRPGWPRPPDWLTCRPNPPKHQDPADPAPQVPNPMNTPLHPSQPLHTGENQVHAREPPTDAESSPTSQQPATRQACRTDATCA